MNSIEEFEAEIYRILIRHKGLLNLQMLQNLKETAQKLNLNEHELKLIINDAEEKIKAEYDFSLRNEKKLEEELLDPPAERRTFKVLAMGVTIILIFVTVVSVIIFSKRNSILTAVTHMETSSVSKGFLNALDTSVGTIDNGRRIALIIGIQKYSGGNWQDLDNSVNDCKSVENVLKKNYGFETIAMLDTDATRTKILDTLDLLAKNLKDNDNLLIYYSGHGHNNPDLLRGGSWVPQDCKTDKSSDVISNSVLLQYLNSYADKAQHVLLICDACFSGDILKAEDKEAHPLNDPSLYADEYNLKSITGITSGGIEPVGDNNGTRGHSAFCGCFLSALETNRKKYFDADELFQYIKQHFPPSVDQKPKHGHIKSQNAVDGEFVFVRK